MTAWTWLGDHLALDVANTIRWPDPNTREELWREPADLHTWLDAEPVDLPRPADVDAEGWRRLIRLRDEVIDLLAAATEGRALPTRAVRNVNETVRVTSTARLLGPEVRTSVTSPGAVDPLDALRGHIAAAAVDLLAREDLANLARCHAPGCGQFFHRSRPNQRWCSPGCGNRARVDRHRHRQSPPKEIA